ncbi:MAG: hypothetical protein R2822_26535 [Spirosomataceae bacterium]
MLQSMPSDNVEKIELISTPPAKYDAAGNTGLTLKYCAQEKQNFGINGNYTLSAGSRSLRKAEWFAGANHRNAKINAFGNLSLFHARFFNTQDIDRTIAYQNQITYIDQKTVHA